MWYGGVGGKLGAKVATGDDGGLMSMGIIAYYGLWVPTDMEVCAWVYRSTWDIKSMHECNGFGRYESKLVTCRRPLNLQRKCFFWIE